MKIPEIFEEFVSAIPCDSTTGRDAHKLAMFIKKITVNTRHDPDGDVLSKEVIRGEVFKEDVRSLFRVYAYIHIEKTASYFDLTKRYAYLNLLDALCWATICREPFYHIEKNKEKIIGVRKFWKVVTATSTLIPPCEYDHWTSHHPDL